MPGKMKIIVLSVVALVYIMVPIKVATTSVTKIGDPCDNSTHICDSSGSLNCDNGKCICLNTHYPDQAVCKPKVALNGTCTGSHQCKNANSGCISKTCQCSEAYYEKSSSCTKRITPGQACDTTITNKNESCVVHAYCNNTLCTCGIGYTAKTDSCNSGLIVFAEVSVLLFSLLFTFYGNN